MFDKAPAVIIGTLLAIAQAIVIFVFNDPTAAVPEWVLAVVTFLAGLLTNNVTFSREQVRKASQSNDPRAIQKLLAK